MALVTNQTEVKQLYDGVALLVGIPTVVPDKLAAKLYGKEGYQVSFEATKPFRDEDGLHLLWKSPFSISDGYAVAAEHTSAAIRQTGVDLSVQSCWFVTDEGLLHETVQLLREREASGYQVGLMLSLPYYFEEMPTPYRIGWTMWETTDPIEYFHVEWGKEVNVVDRLWVPTAWQVPIFEAFFKKPIQVVPLAINPLYSYMDRPVRETFTVVTWGTLTARKCPLETVEVFQSAFPIEAYPDCQLRIKTKAKVWGDLAGRIPTFKDPRITISDGIWLPEDMAGFLYEADCGIFLSRGEGFGMPARESIASGCPTILADNSGHEEVTHSLYTWPVPTKAMVKSPMGGNWWTPDYDMAVDMLRFIYDNREKALDKAANGASWFEEKWGQAAVGAKILEALAEVDPQGKGL